MKLTIKKRGPYYALMLAEGNGWRTVGVYKSLVGAQDALLAAHIYGVGK